MGVLGAAALPAVQFPTPSSFLPLSQWEQLSCPLLSHGSAWSSWKNLVSGTGPGLHVFSHSARLQSQERTSSSSTLTSSQQQMFPLPVCGRLPGYSRIKVSAAKAAGG